MLISLDPGEPRESGNQGRAVKLGPLIIALLLAVAPCHAAEPPTDQQMLAIEYSFLADQLTQKAREAAHIAALLSVERTTREQDLKELNYWRAWCGPEPGCQSK